MANTGTNLPVNRGRISASHPGAGTVAAPPPPSSGPTLLYNELRDIRDASFIRRSGVDSFDRSDLPVIGRSGVDLINRGDITQYTLSSTVPQSRNQQDVGTVVISLPAQPRGQVDGNADHDDWGDAWTDNTVGQTGTNHGNVSPLAMAAGVAGVGVNLAFVEVNLTRFVGLTATGSAHSITGVFTNGSALVASTITAAFAFNTTRQFVESTITQSNQPSSTATLATATLAAGATNAVLTFPFSDGQMTNCLGKWLTLKFSSSGGTVATPDTLVSREGASANRMALTFSASRT